MINSPDKGSKLKKKTYVRLSVNGPCPECYGVEQVRERGVNAFVRKSVRAWKYWQMSNH